MTTLNLKPIELTLARLKPLILLVSVLITCTGCQKSAPPVDKRGGKHTIDRTHTGIPNGAPHSISGGEQNDRQSVEIHYSPAEDLERIDTEILASAKHQIDLTAYSFTDPEIAQVLEDRARDGVHVRIYMDLASTKSELRKSRGREPVIIELLRTPNIEIRVKGSSTLAHMKAFEVDGDLLRTGSANFSPAAEKRQDNDLLIIRNPYAVAAFGAKFQEMWDRPDNDFIQ